MNELGNYLRLRRKSRGYTMKDVYDQAKIAIASQSEFERGHKIPSENMLKRLADVYDLPLRYLEDLLAKDAYVRLSKKPPTP